MAKLGSPQSTLESFVVIRIHVSIVDKHHEETKYVEVIIIIVVNVGRANLIVPRTMMKWIIM